MARRRIHNLGWLADSSTAIIGSRDDGVNLYSLGAKFPSAVTPLDFSWQTLEEALFEVADGVTVLSFIKRLDENQFERPSDQKVITPNSDVTDMIFGVGPDSSDPSIANSLVYHSGRDTASLWLGLEAFTPPPSAPPGPPPQPPARPPPSLPPVPPLPFPPAPPADYDGVPSTIVPHRTGNGMRAKSRQWRVS